MFARQAIDPDEHDRTWRSVECKVSSRTIKKFGDSDTLSMEVRSRDLTADGQTYAIALDHARLRTDLPTCP
jgi:hypothetical protein